MLICTDLGPYSKTTVKLGLQWARKYNYDPIIIHIKPEAGYHTELLAERLEITENAKNHIVENYLLDFNENEQPPLIEVWYGEVMECIQMAISKHKAELLAVGLKGHNLLKDVFLGSTTHKLITHSPINILCLHDEQEKLPTNILFACESLDLESLPLKKLSELQNSHNVMTHILHIVNNQTVANDLKDEALEDIISIDDVQSKARKVSQKKLEAIKQYYQHKTECYILEANDMASGESILEFCKDHRNDLIVLGNHNRRGVIKFFLGSTAEYIVDRSPVSLLIYKQGLY